MTRTIVILLTCLSLTSLAQESPLFIHNGTLVDGTGGRVRKNCDVLIQGGKILNVGEHLRAPANAKKIDATGKTILPGFIDMHGHLYSLVTPQVDAFPKLYLANGVTTLFSPGDLNPQATYDLKIAIRNGTVVGPEIFFAGPYFDSRPSTIQWMPAVNDSVSIAKLFDEWKGKIDGIKVYTSITKEHFDQVVKLAKSHGLFVTGHLGKLQTRYAIRNGISGLEHGLFSINDFGGLPSETQAQLCHVAKLDVTSKDVRKLVDEIVEANVYIDPTLVVLESFSANFRPLPANWREFADEPALQLHVNFVERYKASFDQTCLNEALVNNQKFVKLVHDRNGRIVAGTDPGILEVLPGFSMKREIEILHRSGIPLQDVIKIASLNGASVLGIDNQTGSISIGKNADLSIVDGDITNDISAIENTILVVKRGRLFYTPELLKQVKGKITYNNQVTKP